MKVLFKFYEFKRGKRCLKRVEEFEGTLEEVNKKIDDLSDSYGVNHGLPIIDGSEIILS